MPNIPIADWNGGDARIARIRVSWIDRDNLAVPPELRETSRKFMASDFIAAHDSLE
jgi:hypothetical protein